MKKINEISIIIPVYNGELVIEKCVNSIVIPESMKYEIIIINDNSCDKTDEVINNIISNRNDIVYIKNKKNIGVSASRNIGIKKSKYNYISFLDCDDYVDEELYNYISKIDDEYDLIGFNYFEIINNKRINSKYRMVDDVISSELYLKRALTDRVPLSIWSYIFKRDIINNNNIQFNPSLKISEDNLFLLDYICSTSKIKVLNYYCYYYVQHSTSTMHCLNHNIFQLNTLCSYFSKKLINACSNNEDGILYFKVLCNIKCIHAISNSNSTDKYNYLRKIVNHEYLKYTIHNDFPKYVKIEAIILLLFGIRIHLVLCPIYRLVKSIIRGR